MESIVDRVIQRKWLVPLFAVGAVAFFVVGLALHRSAQPPDVAAVQRGTQVVDLSFFSSNPDADVQVAVDVDASDYETPNYTVEINIDPGKHPYDVLITSSIPDTTHLFRRMPFSMSSIVGLDSPQLYYYVATSPLFNSGIGDMKAKFTLPSTSFLDDKGTLVARMPTVGLQDNSGVMYFGSSTIPARFAGGAVGVEPVYLKPGHSLHSQSPADYITSGQPVGQIYFAPDVLKFHSLVTFTDSSYAMAVAQVQGNSPSNGVFENQGFQWTGQFGLAPYLSLVQPTALEQRSSDDFLSGIFLASAAAALIAFFQEVPDAAKNSTWLARRRKRTALGDATKADTSAPGPPLTAAPPTSTGPPAR